VNRLLCFDYDMTLLDHATGEVPDSTLRAIDLLRPQWKIVIATGRDMAQPESTYGLTTVHPDAVVEMNGARIRAEGKILYRYYLPQALLQTVILFGRQQKMCISCVKDGIYYTTDSSLLESFVHTCVRKEKIQVRPAEQVFGQPVSALTLVGSEPEARLLEQRFPQVRVPLFGKKRGADIIPRTLSKAEGVRRLLDYYDSDFSSVMFFGDSGNDLELIKAASIGVAMGNAIEPVKRSADYVTSAVGDNGIWNALRHFHLLPAAEKQDEKA
jgi:hypothetical protein